MRRGSVLGSLVAMTGGTMRPPRTAMAAPIPKPANTSPG